MLDFQKLIPQIAQIGDESALEENHDSEILQLAQSTFEDAQNDPNRISELVLENGGNAFWPVASPLEPFGIADFVEEYCDSHSVVACDGSQIMPTQHEVLSCYLLNIGAAVLFYASLEEYNGGVQSEAHLNSFPRLYHRSDELYPLVNQRRVHVDEALVSFERSIQELQKARELAERQQALGRKVLTLVDGSLIPWNVDKNADRAQKELLERFGFELDSFNAARLPLVGYVSHSRSSDIVNVLRLMRCPYPQIRCQAYCGSLNEEDFPCSQIWPLADRHLLSSKLPVNARSGFFLSGASWSQIMPYRNQVCFSYLNTGGESARIEVPRWLYEDQDMLAFSLSVLLLQISKGHGYPIALSEAHNMAIVRQADRAQFFALIQEQLLRMGQQRITVSPKENRKRRGIL
ncbi:MAG: DNA double-strand break repair nuclease NurA [Candidatus Obscuribacterales bacterium]|jgi:hypothetical protein|nr:DNA double-strand break repair nuclease NurA [Candidatus Obscuribacterales bacterium]